MKSPTFIKDIKFLIKHLPTNKAPSLENITGEFSATVSEYELSEKRGDRTASDSFYKANITLTASLRDSPRKLQTVVFTQRNTIIILTKYYQ